VIDDPELEARIASFPTWHYDFNLRGHRTNPKRPEWEDMRFSHCMEPVIRHYGGSLEGKRVLDLGCNAGYFSLRAIEAGADFVLGIDGRQMHIDQANLVFEVNAIDPQRFEFACGNILGFEYSEVAPFDLVLCLGVLYHVHKPMELFETIASINTDMLVIDTKVTVGRGSSLDLRRDNLDIFLDAVGTELVMVPTSKAVMVMAEHVGYQAKILSASSRDQPLMEKYRYGVFVAFVCSKLGELSGKGAFQFQPLKALYDAQDEGLKSASWQKKRCS
jgi:SAM-dependent methyltransferase